MVRLHLAIVCLCLLACSSSAKIADGASQAARAADVVGDSARQIKADAAAIEERSTWIATSAASQDIDRPGIVERSAANASAARSIGSAADNAIKAAADVRTSADQIHKAVTGVEDVTPWWAGTVAWVAAAVIVVAILFVLWRSGALAFLGGVFAVVTPRKRQEANLLAKVISPHAEEDVREYAAAKRAADPAFNKAMAAELDRVKLESAKAKEIGNADAR